MRGLILALCVVALSSCAYIAGDDADTATVTGPSRSLLVSVDIQPWGDDMTLTARAWVVGGAAPYLWRIDLGDGRTVTGSGATWDAAVTYPDCHVYTMSVVATEQLEPRRSGQTTLPVGVCE